MRMGVKLVGALGLLALAGCSDKEVAGVSTVETENALLIKVVDSQARPVKDGVARVRALNYLPNPELLDNMNSAGEESLAKDTSVDGTFEESNDFRTDSLGLIHIDSSRVAKFSSDSVIVEILSAGDSREGALSRISLNAVLQNLEDSLEIETAPVGEISGNVPVPEGEEFAWVLVYGTEHWVKTDAQGNFTLSDLPPAEYELRVTVGDSSQNLSAKVSSGESENVGDLLGNYLDIVDFEARDRSSLLRAPMDNNEWYFSRQGDSVNVIFPSDTNILEGVESAGAGRDGYAFHWKSVSGNGSWSNWGIWLCPSENPCDFSDADSIVYYVRGAGSYSFMLESKDTTGRYRKAFYQDTIASENEWIRKSVLPADFQEGDSTWNNFGWGYVSQRVTDISFAAHGEAEFWLDDLRFYGINRETVVK